LRAAFRGPTIRVRLDGGFATPEMFAFLEAQQVEYLVAMASNVRLAKRARRLMGKARMRSRATGQTAHLYGETRYAARTWTRQRRVIMKAEVVRHPGREPKTNPRFVVTTLAGAPQTVYQLYCQRGDMENRLKELHHGLEMDRTSCSRFLANQFRLLLTLAAYILFQELQRRARRTACADAQVITLRERLIKLAVWVERSVRRIVLHLPATCPWLPTWRAARPRRRRDALSLPSDCARRLTAGPVSPSRALSAWAPARRGSQMAQAVESARRHRLVAPRTSPCGLLWAAAVLVVYVHA
jgi:hypothetical protein